MALSLSTITHIFGSLASALSLGLLRLCMALRLYIPPLPLYYSTSPHTTTALKSASPHFRRRVVCPRPWGFVGSTPQQHLRSQRLECLLFCHVL